ncbi:23 kDa U4/U6.U5 small nuclear ribonucleoprotein component [[Candida] anglica]|uniref:23 kDa U4/U6.U5 small nuclear ribonucleoprotein component n=1 Tax=[Candida] anglica TaxID=148631 RepID=A0ABP0EL93_9ASCO
MSKSENEKVSVDQYGRKVWDVDAYAKQANKKVPIKKKLGPLLDSQQSYLSHRDNLLEQSVNAVQQHTLLGSSGTVASIAGADVSTGGTSGGRKKLFGFNCPVCELSFRDTMALVDHFNSPQHISRVKGRSEEQDPDIGVQSATLEEVKAMMETLAERIVRASDGGSNMDTFAERAKKRQEFELKLENKRREKRIQYKQRKRAKQKILEVGSGGDDIEAMLGISGFGSTKR